MKNVLKKAIIVMLMAVTFMTGTSKPVVNAASYNTDSRSWSNFDCGCKITMKAYFDKNTDKFVKFATPQIVRKGNLDDYDFKQLASSSKYVGRYRISVTDVNGDSEVLTISVEWDSSEDDADWDYEWD